MRTIREERLARDPETMMNIVNSDPGHIARVKARQARTKRGKQAPKEPVGLGTVLLGVVAIFSTWCLALVCLV